jgi:hypothetical protein
MNQTRPHCVNQMEKTHSKALAARYGRGTAWARHAMCESSLTVSPGMEEMPSLNKPIQRLKVTILPLDLPCSGSVTHSGEILTTGKSHGKKPD